MLNVFEQALFMSMNMFTKQEKNLLHIIQSHFPLMPKPYAVIARALGMHEDEVLDSLKSLKERKILKEIRGIFNATLLDYHTVLIAFKLEEDLLPHAAQVVSNHPGVSHNYQRFHALNLWFTLSVPADIRLETHIQALADMTACQQYFVFPALKTFKRRVKFTIAETTDISDVFQQGFPLPEHKNFSHRLSKHSECSGLAQSTQQCVMRMLHEDLALHPEPFRDIARQCSIAEECFFDFVGDLLRSHKMSRFAGILYHRNLGFTTNAMVVWKVPASTLVAFAEEAVTYQAISHCYERSVYPDWPYNLYTMIHSTSQREMQEIVESLATKFTIQEYEVLCSGAEHKKQRVDYFGKDIYEWDRKYVRG